MNIIQYLLNIIQYLYQQNCWLLSFICRYMPLKQWSFDDSHSPKYQKFKVDELPRIADLRQDWTNKGLIPYYESHYGKKIRPISRRSDCDIPKDCSYPRYDAPMPFLYKNNGSKKQLLCKIFSATFLPDEGRFSAAKLQCPHCGRALTPKKERKHFIVHKCVNPECPYYLNNLKKFDKTDLAEKYGKNKYKLHYIWLIINAATRSILGYQVSDNRGVGPCILAMWMAFQNLKKLPEKFKFIADGYSTYPLAAMEFAKKFGNDFSFSVTRVIELTNDDAVSKEYRPFKQMIERLNRTYKASYRQTNGFDNIDGANYDLALWVAYYNFLLPHKHAGYKVLNEVEMLQNADNMPAKWQILIYLGQQTILDMQKNKI